MKIELSKEQLQLIKDAVQDKYKQLSANSYAHKLVWEYLFAEEDRAGTLSGSACTPEKDCCGAVGQYSEHYPNPNCKCVYHRKEQK